MFTGYLWGVPGSCFTAGQSQKLNQLYSQVERTGPYGAKGMKIVDPVDPKGMKIVDPKGMKISGPISTNWVLFFKRVCKKGNDAQQTNIYISTIPAVLTMFYMSCKTFTAVNSWKLQQLRCWTCIGDLIMILSLSSTWFIANK